MSTEARVRALQAEAELKNAQRDVAAEDHEQLRQQLAAVRAQLRTAKQTYERLRRQLRNGEAEVAVLQSRVDGLGAQLGALLQRRPPAADFLPDDPECRAWQAQHDELTRQRAEAIAARDRAVAAMPNRLEAAKHEGNLGVLANLQRAEANMIRKLRRERIGAGHEGGVFRVL